MSHGSCSGHLFSFLWGERGPELCTEAPPMALLAPATWSIALTSALPAPASWRSGDPLWVGQLPSILCGVQPLPDFLLPPKDLHDLQSLPFNLYHIYGFSSVFSPDYGSRSCRSLGCGSSGFRPLSYGVCGFSFLSYGSNFRHPIDFALVASSHLVANLPIWPLLTNLLSSSTFMQSHQNVYPEFHHAHYFQGQQS